MNKAKLKDEIRSAIKGSKTTFEKGKIVHRGIGGFMDPPGYPTHDWSVQTDLRRRPENRGMMSIPKAAQTPWLDGSTRAQAQNLLDEWESNHPDISSPQIQDWIHQVLGYFRGMYRNQNVPEDQQFHASHLISAPNRNPISGADDHAGVRWIRKFYPKFKPSANDFNQAYWGTP